MARKQLLLVFTFLCGVCACECLGDATRWNLDTFGVEVLEGNGRTLVDRTVASDTVLLQLDFEAAFVEHRRLPRGTFVSVAYATSCVDDGDAGMQNALDSLIVTSDAPFGTLPAGAPLNSLLRVDNDQSVAAWLAGSAAWTFRFADRPALYFTTAPAANSEHRFTLRFRTTGGNEIVQTTEAVRWQ